MEGMYISIKNVDANSVSSPICESSDSSVKENSVDIIYTENGICEKSENTLLEDNPLKSDGFFEFFF